MPSFATHSAQWHDRPWFGVGLFVTNLMLMAIMGAMVKALSVRYPLSELLFFRFAIATLAFVILLPSIGGLAGLATSRPVGHAVRTISGIVSLSLFYLALATIPIADATALTFSAPLFIVVLSIPVLGETIGWRRWCAVIVGFIGVLLITQPSGGLAMGSLAAIGAAVFSAIVSISLRRLSKTEKTATIGLYYNATGTVFYGGWLILAGWVLPTIEDAMWLLLFGVFAGFQQWTLIHSHRYAEASLLAPFDYVILIFAAIIGYVFWGEMPPTTTWLGASVIVASGLFIIARKRAKSDPSNAA